VTPDLAAYHAAVVEAKNAHPTWRWGQAAYNTLRVMRPGLALKVQATDNDPFWQKQIPARFWTWVTEHWEDA